MKERRKLKRRHISYYLPVLDANTEQIIGHLVDITPLGLMLDSQSLLPLEQEYNLRLNLTEEVADKDFMVLVGRSKWCQQDYIEPYIYNIGFKLLNITPEDTEIVQRIMDNFGAQESYTFR